MSIKQKQPSAVESPILQSLEQMPDRDAQKERVKRMTAAELQSLVKEIKNTPKKPSVFESPEVLTELEKRLQEENISFDTDAWQKSALEQAKGAAMDKAEQGFLKQLMEKGGGWAVVGSAAITILSWLGFSKAKALRNSIKNKGYLRTAVEGAKEHPIFAAFISALGIKASYDLYKYLETNAAPITDAIAQKAKEMGVPGVDAAKKLADQAREIIANGIDLGFKGAVVGVTKVLGGTYDEETGVVSLGHSTLHTPVLTAYEAGFRRRAASGLTKGTFSRLIVEDRLSAVLRQSEHAHLRASEAKSYKKLMAQRGLELLKKPTLDAASQAEVERIVGALGPDLGLEGKALQSVQVSKSEATKHLTDIESQIKVQSEEEVLSFNKLKNNIENKMLDAEERLRKGKYIGSAESYKKGIVDEVNAQTKAFRDKTTAEKIGLSQQYVETLNALEGTIGEHAHFDLDPATHGRGRAGTALEKTTRTVEEYGMKLRRLPGGKLAVGALLGYSFLPLALEGAAALRPGEAGEAAKKALMIDATDAGVGFIPVVGELNDFRAAIWGTDLNGREIDTKTRVISGVMGTLGTGALVLGFFTGGSSIAIFKVARGALAARRAVKAAKLAENGVTVANVTQKGLKALQKSEKGAEAVEKMYTITKTQKIARRAQNVFHNAQRGMQLATYADLGVQLASGVTEIWNSAEGVAGWTQDKLTQGVNIAEQFATDVAQKIS